MMVFDQAIPYAFEADSRQVETIKRLLDTCNVFTSQLNCLEILFLDSDKYT